MATYEARNTAYAAALGLAGILGGCANSHDQKHNELNMNEFQRDHYAQNTPQTPEKFYPFTSASFIMNADGSEGLAYVFVDIDNKIPYERIERGTPFQWDLIITRDRTKYPLNPEKNKEMKWHESTDQKNYKRHFFSIAREGGPYADRIFVHVPIETMVRRQIDQDFKERLENYWASPLVNFEIMSDEEVSELYQDNKRTELITKLTEKQK